MAFIYLIEFHGSARNKQAPAGAHEQIAAFMARLNKSNQIADAIKSWIEKGLPAFLNIQVRIDFIPESLEWSGVVEIADWHGRLASVVGLDEYVSHLARASVNRVIQQLFEKQGYKQYNYRTVSALLNAHEHPEHSEKQAIALPETPPPAMSFPRWYIIVSLLLLFATFIVSVIKEFFRP
ncbi:MAG: hypothetical protein R2880_12780 [Deinococcales bacterium]